MRNESVTRTHTQTPGVFAPRELNYKDAERGKEGLLSLLATKSERLFYFPFFFSEIFVAADDSQRYPEQSI